MSSSYPPSLSPPTTSTSPALLHLKSLIQRKGDLELQIEVLSTGGTEGQTRLGEALVDSEGFPRGDVDVHGVRAARQSLAQLQTDHMAVMKEIETSMFALHAEAKRNKQLNPSPTPAPSLPRILPTTPERKTAEATILPPPSSTPRSPAPSPLDAFLLCDQVFEDSPAQVAGLHIGDRVIAFGGVRKGNYTKEAMRQVVSNSVGRGIRVEVYTVGEGIRTLTLTPQRWSGQGLLGCHLADL